MEHPKEKRNLNGDWYWISRAFLHSYGRILKPSGIAVYNVLASFANSKTQCCFPTHRTIAKIAGTSKRTVSVKLQQLEQMELISCYRQKGQCIYRLLECSEMKKNGPEAQQMSFPDEKSDL
jgi:hypothetical protein